MKGKRGDRPDVTPAEVDAMTADKPDDTAPSDAPVKPAKETPAKDKPAVPEKPEPMVTQRVIVETVRHEFTVAELAEIADQMGRAAAHVFQAEREKTEAAARCAAEVKAANLAHGALVEKFNLRYEMRDIRCKVVYDSPEPGLKSHVSEDDETTVIKTLHMTYEEKQRAFVFGEPGDGKPQ
jgi:hypothetical protein